MRCHRAIGSGDTVGVRYGTTGGDRVGVALFGRGGSTRQWVRPI